MLLDKSKGYNHFDLSCIIHFNQNQIVSNKFDCNLTEHAFQFHLNS